MKVVPHTTYEYIAIDGEKFATQHECITYEESLPRHLRYCLENKFSSDDLSNLMEGHYEIGYTISSTFTMYEPPSFLKEGGDSEQTITSEKIMFRYRGTFSDVIYEAVKDNKFWHARKDSFVRKVEFKHISTES